MSETIQHILEVKGEVVVFLDGNTRNFKINNLYKVSRAIHGIKNTWYKTYKGITPYQIAELKHIIRVKNKTYEKCNNKTRTK